MKVFQLAGAALAAALISAPVFAADPPPAFGPCKACHKLEAGAKLLGPSLFGVYGKKAGSMEGFAYSDAFKKTATWVWDDEHLEKWLSGPGAMVPGTKMAFPGLKKPEDVKAVIDFLKTVK
jgi:cytochrome c